MTEYVTVEDAIEAVRKFAREHNLGPTEFAGLADLSKNTMVGFLTRADWRPNSTTLRALNKVMTEYRE